MPGQEAFPTVLAMVLMDQCLVVEAAAVFGPMIQIVDLPEHPPQTFQFALTHAIQIDALFQFAGSGRSPIRVTGKPKLNHAALGDGNGFILFTLQWVDFDHLFMGFLW